MSNLCRFVRWALADPHVEHIRRNNEAIEDLNQQILRYQSIEHDSLQDLLYFARLRQYDMLECLAESLLCVQRLQEEVRIAIRNYEESNKCIRQILKNRSVIRATTSGIFSAKIRNLWTDTSAPYRVICDLINQNRAIADGYVYTEYVEVSPTQTAIDAVVRDVLSSVFLSDSDHTSNISTAAAA